MSSVPRTEDTTADKIQSHCQHHDGAHRVLGLEGRCSKPVQGQCFIHSSFPGAENSASCPVNPQSIFVDEKRAKETTG